MGSKRIEKSSGMTVIKPERRKEETPISMSDLDDSFSDDPLSCKGADSDDESDDSSSSRSPSPTTSKQSGKDKKKKK
jgi:hypothetical protein